MTVYVIMKGEYSDRHIERIFLDETKAEKYCEVYNAPIPTDDSYYRYEIEEYETSDDSFIAPEEVHGYKIMLTQKGDVYTCEPVTFYETEHYKVKNRFNLTVINRSEYFRAEVIADDKKTAIKIARDERAKCLAEKYGL